MTAPPDCGAIRTGGPGRERGFALLLVLLALGMMSLLIARLLSDGRVALVEGRAVRDAAAAEAAADGAVQQAIFELRRGRWAADGRPRLTQIGRAAVAVTVIDDRGRINPNRAAPQLMAALLIDAGAQPAQAETLAAAIVDWRTATPFSIVGGLKLDQYRQAGLPYGPPDRPFTSVDELAQVPGMTPALLARVRPYLSVYQSGTPVAAGDDAALRAALQTAELIGRAPPPSDVGTADRVVEVTSVARLPGGVRFARTATIRLGNAPGERREWQILTWTSGPGTD